jgi:hypothetical protein
MTTLTQAHAEALRRVTTYLAEEHDDMQVYLTMGGKPEDHIAYYVTVLEGLLDAYDTTKGESK